MKIFKLTGLAVTFSCLVLLLNVGTAHAGWVKGYTKSDGTYVNGYWRSDPNGLKYDNYSFDGDWSDAFNDSYFSSSRDYSSDWYTPTWITQDDYWVGKSFYDSRNSYSSFDYNSFDYDYDFWDDPIYNYKPSYNYGYNYSSDFDSYSSPYYDSYDFDTLGSSYTSPYSSSFGSSYDNDWGSSYNSYDSYDYNSYNSGYSDYDYGSSYDYSSSYDSCYSYYSC